MDTAEVLHVWASLSAGTAENQSFSLLTRIFALSAQADICPEPKKEKHFFMKTWFPHPYACLKVTPQTGLQKQPPYVHFSAFVLWKIHSFKLHAHDSTLVH